MSLDYPPKPGGFRVSTAQRSWGDAWFRTSNDASHRAEVRRAIDGFLIELSLARKVTHSAEVEEAATQLFEVFRSWPEQSNLIGVRHREVSNFRLDDHHVLTSNHPNMIFSVEPELNDGNLDYVDFVKDYAFLLTKTNKRPGISSSFRITFEVKSGHRRSFTVDVSDFMEANVLQKQIDSKLEQIAGQDGINKLDKGSFIVSGGPLSIQSPLTINYAGELKKDTFIEIKSVDPATDSFYKVVSVHRYMKVTPLVAEVRRQVKEVEDDLEHIKGGWLHWSPDKHQVPKNACYTASWKDCGQLVYVWVCPEGRKEFEDFTIKILNFSDLIKDVKLSGSSGVKYSPASASPTIR